MVSLADPDGNGYYILGLSDSDTSGEKTEDSRGGEDIWIAKIDSEGAVEWDKTIGGELTDGIEVDVLFQNGQIFILASSSSPVSGDKTSPNYGGTDLWLLCVDLSGNVLWDKTYGGSETERANSILALDNGNLLLTGRSSSGISGNKTDETNGESDYWLLEVTADDGTIIKQKSIGSSGSETSVSSVTDAGGNIYILGTASTGTSGDKTDAGYGCNDMWLVKLDPDFNVIDDKCYGGDDCETFFGDMLLEDNSIYFIAGSPSEPSGNKTAPSYGQRDYWMVKIDLDLNLVWDKVWGGGSFDTPRSIITYSPNRLVISGSSSSNVSGNKTAPTYGSGDIWMIIVDTDGNEINQEVYGGSGFDQTGDVLGDGMGNLFVTGSSESNISGVKTENSRGGADYWVLYLDASDYVSVENMNSEFSESITAYPNPFINEVSFDLSEISEPTVLSIYTAEGKLVYRESVQNQSSVRWQPKENSASFYIYELKSSNHLFKGKLVRGF